MIKDRVTYSEYERGYYDCLDNLYLNSKDCDEEPKRVINIILNDLEENFMVKCES